MDIPEYKRDESKDHLVILKSLNEIPFPIGRALLMDFLLGKSAHPSIEKNKMDELSNFGALNFLGREKVLEIVENLIVNGLIDVSGSVFNKFAKVLSISVKGKNELIDPNLNSKKLGDKYEEFETSISDSEMRAFKELGDFLGGFNDEQKKAIISPKKNILCIAGAGTGKTTVLTKRVEFLNKYNRVSGNSLLAITFTRKAKEEMQKRLETSGVKAVVETFNSFCEKILLKNGGKVYGRKVRIAGYQEKMVAILRALDNLGINLETAIERYFNPAQRRNKTLYQLQNIFVNDCFSVLDYFRSTKREITGDFKGDSKIIIEIVKLLDKYLKNNGLRTYADQVNDVVDFFKLHPKFIPKFEHVLVDEFQDVNSNQIELLDLLNSENLFCVGDPRQSIFGWRGSDIDYILKFKDKYPGAQIINLKKNYRSSEHLVNLMNSSIKSLKMPDLESDLLVEKHLKLESFSDEKEEFGFILSEILQSSLPLEEIFILARTNRQLKDFSDILKKEKIKHLVRNEDNPNVEIRAGHLMLSTIHSIKGLEAEMVFVIGCNNNNFPCRVSEHPVIEELKMYEYDKEEEERRLFYVAISRAKNRLYLTYSGKKHTYFISDEMKKMFD